MDKKELRRLIAQQKRNYSVAQKTEWSSSLFQKLEGHPLFLQAHTLLLYHSLPDEVLTHEFIKRWHPYKRIVLPLVKGDELEFRYYEGEDSLQIGAFGIEEPTGSLVENLHEIELSIIPGVAFDRSGNRLGRGKGYYDRLLPRIPTAYKAGICFPFQLVEEVPAESFDVRMDIIITINEDELSHPYHPLPSCDRE